MKIMDTEQQERASMRTYLDRKRIFDDVCKEEGYSTMENVILFHGYIGGLNR